MPGPRSRYGVLERSALGLAVAAALLGLVELGLWGAGAAAGQDWRVPPPLQRIPEIDPPLCELREPAGSLRLCPRFSGDSLFRRVRTTPFAAVPDRPRIIVLGESFVFGLFLEDEETWPARMGSHLGEGVEVLNFGQAGSGAAHLRLMAQAALSVQPTALVLAIGNNEYSMSPYYSGLAGRHPVLFHDAATALSRLQLYGLLQRHFLPDLPPGFAEEAMSFAGHPMERYIEALHGRPADISPFPNGLADPDVTEMLEETKALSERFFRANMEQMIAAARARGVTVFLATLPRVLRHPPLLSGIHGTDRASVERATTALNRPSTTGGEVGAELIDAVEAALALDPHNANFLYQQARILERQGRGTEASRYYEEAMQWDLVPDVTPTINAIIRELADKYGCPLIDLNAITRENLDRRFNSRLFRDPIHTTAEGAEYVGESAAREVTAELDLAPRAPR